MRDRQRYWYWYWYWYWPVLFAVPLIGLVTAVVVIAVTSARRGPVELTLRMRPAPPQTIAGCIGQLTSYGFSSSAASQLCSLGAGRSWYHAVLTSHGAGAYPLCHARALDSRGKIVFSGPLFFNFGGGIAGLYARGHRSVTFS